jgi:hypothetical protein
MTDDDINAALALVGQAAGVTQRIDGWISTRRLLTADAQISGMIYLTKRRLLRAAVIPKGHGADARKPASCGCFFAHQEATGRAFARMVCAARTNAMGGNLAHIRGRRCAKILAFFSHSTFEAERAHLDLGVSEQADRSVRFGSSNRPEGEQPRMSRRELQRVCRRQSLASMGNESTTRFAFEEMGLALPRCRAPGNQDRPPNA